MRMPEPAIPIIVVAGARALAASGKGGAAMVKRKLVVAGACALAASGGCGTGFKITAKNTFNRQEELYKYLEMGGIDIHTDRADSRFEITL